MGNSDYAKQHARKLHSLVNKDQQLGFPNAIVKVRSSTFNVIVRELHFVWSLMDGKFISQSLYRLPLHFVVTAPFDSTKL